MQRLEVSCAVRRIYTSLGAKGLNLGLLKGGENLCYLSGHKYVENVRFEVFTAVLLNVQVFWHERCVVGYMDVCVSNCRIAFIFRIKQSKKSHAVDHIALDRTQHS